MESFVMKAETLPPILRKKINSPRVTVQERAGTIVLIPIFESAPHVAELEARKALKMRMKKYRGIVRSDIDEKAELAAARSEKYESVN